MAFRISIYTPVREMNNTEIDILVDVLLIIMYVQQDNYEFSSHRIRPKIIHYKMAMYVSWNRHFRYRHRKWRRLVDDCG